MQQRWLKLLFVHYEVDADWLQKQLPEGLQVDTHGGKAWLGIVPFVMEGVRPRGVPRIPPLTDFPEINLRTYVTCGRKPGVWFISLDITSGLGVWIARKFFHLPYFKATVEVAADGTGTDYRLERGPVRWEGRYAGFESVETTPGSFEDWATERYCLYAANAKGHLFRGEVHHPKWPLQRAELEESDNTMLDGLPVGPRHPALLYSEALDVVVWPLARV